MIKSTHDDILWAAGFLDGDGTINMYRHKPKKGTKQNYVYGLRVSVSNTVYEVLQWYKDRWGGGISEVSTAPSYQKRSKLRFWDWHIYGAKALSFIQDVRPYLKIKDVEASLATEYWEGNPPPLGHNQPSPAEDIAYREKYYRRIREAHGSKAVRIDSRS